MKKILSIMLIAMLAVPMFAEKMTPEARAAADYTSWLPAAGDFSIGFSLDPFADFIGKMFQSAQASDYKGEIGGQALVNPLVSIMGSYMLTDQLAVKANVGFIVGYNRTMYNVQDDAAKFANPYSNAQVNDVVKAGQYGGSFSAGVEYRIGKRRVQGVFGGGLVYAFQTKSLKYEYGNVMTEANQVPTTFNNTAVYQTIDYLDNARIVNDAVSASGKDQMWNRIGLYTSAGIEWFISPKVALGMNVNLDLLYKWSNNVCMQYEGWNTTSNQKEIYTDTRGMRNYSGVTFNTENIGANLYFNFFL